MIKFNKFNVTNTETKIKARVHYSHGNRVSDGRACVTIYAKDVINELPKIFTDGEYENNSDMMTDYIETSKVVLFTDHPLYAQALERAKLER